MTQKAQPVNRVEELSSTDDDEEEIICAPGATTTTTAAAATSSRPTNQELHTMEHRMYEQGRRERAQVEACPRLHYLRLSVKEKLDLLHFFVTAMQVECVREDACE